MRIQPLHSPYPSAVQALLNRLPAAWSPPFKLFTVLARDDRLLQRFINGAVAYLEPSHVTIRQREVFLLRVTARCQCPYEWGLRVHYFAQDADLTESQLRATVYGPSDDPAWSPVDSLLLELADELHDSVSISDTLWTGLRAVFKEEAVLQLIMMAGYYRMVAYVANGLQLPLEPGIGRSFPEPATGGAN